MKCGFIARASFALVIVLQCGGCFFFSSDHQRYLDHTVHSGETISSISSRYGVSPESVIELNDIDDPKNLKVGQVIRIPFSTRSSRPPVDSAKFIKISSARHYVGNLDWPVPGAKLSSRFGTRWLNFHEGLDLSAPEGTPIYAAHDGVVVYSNDGFRGYGNLIVVRGEGILTVYGHNRVNRVDRGERVSKGERIAEVGESGKAQGPHLHFETRIKDSAGTYTAIDPLVFFP